MSNKQINKGTFYSLIKFCLIMLVMVVQYAFAARFLQPAPRGMYFILISFYGYLAFFDFGIKPTLVREIAFARRHGKVTANLLEVTGYANKCYKLLAIVCFLFVMVLSTLLAWREHLLSLPLLLSFGIVAVSLSLRLYGNKFSAWVIGNGSVDVQSKLESLSQIITLGSLLLLHKFGVVGLSIPLLLNSLFIILADYCVIKNRVNILRPPKVLDKVRIKAALSSGFMKSSLKLALIGLGSVLVFQTDFIIISIVVGPAAVAQYAPLVQLTTAIMYLSTIYCNMQSPHISSYFSCGDLALVKTAIKNNLYICCTICVFSLVALTFIAPVIFQFWLGNNFIINVPAIAVLSLIVLFEVHQLCYSSAAMAAKNLVFWRYSIASGIVNVVLSIILGKMYGVTGVALGTFISHAIFVFFYSIKLSLNWFQMTFISFFRVYLGLFVVCLSYFILSYSFMYTASFFGVSLFLRDVIFVFLAIIFTLLVISWFMSAKSASSSVLSEKFGASL